MFVCWEWYSRKRDVDRAMHAMDLGYDLTSSIVMIRWRYELFDLSYLEFTEEDTRAGYRNASMDGPSCSMALSRPKTTRGLC